MKLFIPQIGTEIKLSQPWAFDVHHEYRNHSLLQYLYPADRLITWDDSVKTPFTLPEGSVLKIYRIYVRRGKAEFSSITFTLSECPDPSLAPKKKGGYRSKAVSFWVKLEDANRIEGDII